MQALQTRGVNVRPRRPQRGSCPPVGLTTSGQGWVLPGPRRPKVALKQEREVADYGRMEYSARRRMHAAQDAVRTAKAQGGDIRQLAAAARQARAEWLRLTDGLERASVTVAESSAVNRVRAV